MKPITEYRDYRRCMQDFYDERKRTNSFTWREFARLAGFTSPIYLKLVCEGKSSLSELGIERSLPVIFPYHRNPYDNTNGTAPGMDGRNDTRPSIFVSRGGGPGGSWFRSADQGGDLVGPQRPVAFVVSEKIATFVPLPQATMNH